MNDIKGKMLILDPTKRTEEMLKMAGADKLIKIMRSNDNFA